MISGRPQAIYSLTSLERQNKMIVDHPKNTIQTEFNSELIIKTSENTESAPIDDSCDGWCLDCDGGCHPTESA